MLTSFISIVPGLKVSTKVKKALNKDADHSSTQPPAYERIKAQLERRKKRQQQAQQSRSQPADHSQKKKQREQVVQRSRGSDNLKDAQESMVGSVGNTRRDAPTDEKRAAGVERGHRMRREAKAAEEEWERQLDEELEEAERELEIALDDCVRSANGEDREDDVDRAMVALKPDSECQKDTQHGEVHPGSQAVTVGSAERSKVSSQRQMHQERLENLASQKRSQEKDRHSQFVKKPEEESVTESESPIEDSETDPESDEDVPVPVKPCHKTRSPSLSITEPESEVAMQIQSTQVSSGKKRVSHIFIFISAFNLFISSLLILS